MPLLKTYDLFISHAWRYGDEYNRLTNMLDSATNFCYRNYSAPEYKPLVNLDSTDVQSKRDIEEAIKRKIKPVNAVLIISGMYYNYREWMQYELNVAKEYNKPIIAVKPYRSLFTPKEIIDNCNTLVGWNTNSIVQAIRDYSI